MENLRKQNFRELESWKRSGFLELAERALATRHEQSNEIKHLSTYGKEMWVLMRFVPVAFEGEQHLLMLLMDIGERQACGGRAAQPTDVSRKRRHAPTLAAEAARANAAKSQLPREHNCTIQTPMNGVMG